MQVLVACPDQYIYSVHTRHVYTTAVSGVRVRVVSSGMGIRV